METTKSTAFDQRIAAIHMLRVNLKSLAAEAGILRKETARCGVAYKNALALHRVNRLRQESRYTQLALAFVRGTPYRQVEKSAKVPIVAGKLARKVGLFVQTSETQIVKWLS